MMPKLPPPDDVSGHPFRYTANAMIAYGRAVAEACAVIGGDAQFRQVDAETAILEAAKEIGQ